MKLAGIFMHEVGSLIIVIKRQWRFFVNQQNIIRNQPVFGQEVHTNRCC